jgi:hypothetical protein
MLSLVCVTSSVEREPGGEDPEGETKRGPRKIDVYLHS